jgi:ABC-type transporter Mla subunit MlaD
MVRLPLPGPRDLLRVADRGYQAIEQAIAFVPRIADLLEQVQRIVQRADDVITEVGRTRQRADQLVAGVDRTRQNADEVVSQVQAVITRTEPILVTAEQLTGQGTELLAKFEPSLDKLAPLAAQLAETTSPAEVTALIGLIDHLPTLVKALETDVLPVLATLGTVAPDVRDLLDTMREFNEIIGSLPGLGRIKKRVEERQEQQDAQRSDADRSEADRPQSDHAGTGS